MSKSHGTTFRSRSSDHVPVVPTMVSHPVGVKRIHVFRNGDAFFQGIQVVVNTHRVPSVNVLLDVISERIGLVNGAKKLFTMNGSLVKDINRIKDGESYVASSSHFTPMSYGGQIARRDEERKKKKKTKRSKTVDAKDRNEVVIPLEEEHREDVEKVSKKLKKKKKKVTKKEHHGSNETLETAEIELPSEIEDSEQEEDHHNHREHHEESRNQTPSDHRPPTGLPPRSASRRESRRDIHEEKHEKKEEKRRKSMSKRRKFHSQNPQPNWGDLSSFTKNIESLLKN